MCTWRVCPLYMCAPMDVCVSAVARRQGARVSLIPPLCHPQHMQAHSPGSSNTSHRSRYYSLQAHTRDKYQSQLALINAIIIQATFMHSYGAKVEIK